MSFAEGLPLWAALISAALVVLGAALALIGAVGVLRFRSFFERVHATTLASSWGTAAVALSSMLLFSVLASRPILHEILIGIFLTITTPVTLILLARAVLYRDRTEGNNVPPHSAVRRRPRPPGTS